MKHDFNQLLLTLYNNPGEHYLAEEDQEAFNDLPAILEETSKTGLVYLGNGHKGTYYKISQKGKDFIAGLPVAYKQNPYDYYISVYMQPAFPQFAPSYLQTALLDQEEVTPPRQWYESWQFWIIFMGILLAFISLLRRH